MKRLTALCLVIVFAFSLVSCAMTQGIKPDAVEKRLAEKAAVKIEGTEEEMESLKDEKTVSVHLHKDKKKAKTLDLLVTDELLELFSADWKKASSKGGGNKVITFTIDVQHEVTFFDNGRAMIYYGYCSVLEKDRAYYEITLENGLESLYNYAKENGTEPVSDEEETNEQEPEKGSD